MRTAQAPQTGRLLESALPAASLLSREADAQTRTQQVGSVALRARRCDFPQCLEAAVADAAMCWRHENVTVSGSWVDDKHADTGHG